MAEWDTLAIQERVLRDARVPRGSLYSSLDALLPLLDQHLRTVIVPRLLDVGEDYLAATQSYAVTAGKGAYRLPPRSLRLLEVSLVGPDGRPRAFFSRATPTQVTKFRSYNRVRPTGPPEFWWFEASAVQLYPSPSATDGSTLVLRYARRPSRLVDPGDCNVVSVIDPTGIGTMGPLSLLSGSYDIVKGSPGFESLVDNTTFTLNVAFITPGAAILAQMAVGDYVCVPGTSPVPQVPLLAASICPPLTCMA